MTTQQMQHIALLEEGVSCATATLAAIQAGDFFGHVPADPDRADGHNHGCWLLAMLADHLRKIEADVAALSDTPTEGGR